MIRLAILLSGRGSNFQAIHDAIAAGRLDATIVSVISNVPEAPGLARARELGLSSHSIDQRAYSTRPAHEEEVLRALAEAQPDFICLAGYMRLLSPDFVAAYQGRILNIHPSLLPSFPGLEAQKQAIEHGVKWTGCTVHFVDDTLDGGPIIAQRAIPVSDHDTEETLAHRLLSEEHQLYIEALALIVSGKYEVVGRRVLRKN